MKKIDAPIYPLLAIYIGEIAQRDLQALDTYGDIGRRPYNHQDQGFFISELLKRIRTPLDISVTEFLPTGKDLLAWIHKYRESEFGWYFQKIQRKFKLNYDAFWPIFNTIMTMFTLWLTALEKEEMSSTFNLEKIRDKDLAILEMPLSVLLFDFLGDFAQQEIKKRLEGKNIPVSEEVISYYTSASLVLRHEIFFLNKSGRETLEELEDGTVKERIQSTMKSEDWTKICTSQEFINMTTFIVKFMDYLSYLKTGKD